MNIVKATSSDYETILPLFQGLDDLHAHLDPERFQPFSGPARTKAAYDSYLDGEDRALFVAMVDGEAVGFVNLWIVDVEQQRIHVGRRYAHLDNIYVSPSCRRNGLATALLRRAKDWCKEVDIHRIELQVYAANEDAIAWYDAHGFGVFLKRFQLDIE
jgi:ribosomal protein S18 acetylase RimI-like enzyme